MSRHRPERPRIRSDAAGALKRSGDIELATLKELLAQREAIEQQIEQTKKSERGAAVNKVRAMMAEYGLTVADLGGKSAGKAKSGGTGKRYRPNIATPRPANPGAAAVCNRAG